MKVNITYLTIKSYDEIFALWQQSEGIGLSSADSRECIQTYLERNPDMSFIALADGRIVGAVLAGHDGRRGYIHHLAVHSDYRQHGIGRQLAERSLKALKKAGIQKCHIFIFHSNTEGISFWKSVGWTQRSDINVISKTIEQGTESD